MSLPIIVTLAAIVCWAALSVASRVLLLGYDLDPWSFSFVQLCAGGVVLLAASGREIFDLSSFRRPSTWVLGVLRVFSAALYTAVLAWVSVLEAGIMGAIIVPLIAVAVALIYGRRPARGEWVGHLVILGAIAVFLSTLEPEIWRPAVGLMALNALCIVATSILLERHPDNISAQPKARLRFTGAVLLVTAVLFLVVRMAQGGLTGAGVDWPLLLAAGGVGVLLRAPSMVLSFWSIRLIGAQNYLASVSLLPLIGMGFEQAAFAAGLLAVSRFQIGSLILALVVVGGTALVLVARRHDQYRP